MNVKPLPSQKHPQQLVEGEHIFPASKLTPLAIKWKQLYAAGRHKEAMLVLEEIVIGSTAMFERLAQFEDFHFTVDLPILVSAAQEKVIKWLIKWQPKKGKLFSWFSKSLTGDSRVLLADGSLKRLDEIVNGRLPVSVVSWDAKTKTFVNRSVTGWSVCPTQREGWRKVSVQHPAGFNRCLFATWDHEFQTQRGWVKVDDLKSKDQLYLRAEQITNQGISVLVGLYLGDGHINRKYALVVGHTKPQRFYTEHIAQHFGKNVYDSEVTVRGKKHKVTSCCVPLRAIWQNCHLLPRKKTVTGFVLENLNDIALAYWYMDDGSYDQKRGAAKLATESFSPEDCAKLQEVLRCRFGIQTHYHKRKGKNYGYLQVIAASRDNLFRAVAPYILPGFYYKCPPEYRFDYDSRLVLTTNVLLPCSFKKRGIIGHTNIRNGRSDSGVKRWFTPDFSLKYDITVEGTENFVAEGILVHNCAKNAFRSELGRVNQYRRRYHVTSENLERFYGAEDHEVDKHDLASEMQNRINSLTCRWGDPQEIGAIRFLTLCVLEDDHDKHASIRSAAYAYGLCFEQSKFFYNWVVVNLRHAFYDKAYVPFTEHDLMLAAQSYTYWAEFVEIVGIENARKCVAVIGGVRLKIPTLQCFAKQKANYQLMRDIDSSDLDPDSVAEVARKHKKTPRGATEIFHEMVEQLDPKRYGEHAIFGEDSTEQGHI